MDALQLDPDGYPGSYKLIAGRLSLDLVNTVSWPGTAREHDWLSDSENVTLWLAAVGLPCNDVRESDRSEIDRIRSVLTSMLRPLAHSKSPAPQDVAEFNKLLNSSLRRRRIDPIDLTWGWETSRQASDCFDPVVFDAAELITAEGRERLKHCPSCDWLFQDQSRNGQRRWCDMADCGSRAKARDYYHRHKPQPRQT